MCQQWNKTLKNLFFFLGISPLRFCNTEVRFHLLEQMFLNRHGLLNFPDSVCSGIRNLDTPGKGHETQANQNTKRGSFIALY